MRNLATVAITCLVLLSFLLACAQPAAPTAVPAKPVAPAVATTAPASAAATSAPAAATKPAAPAATAAPTAGPAAKIKRGGTIISSYHASRDTLDLKLSKVDGHGLGILMYDALLRLDLVDPAGKFEPKGELAESWSVPDPKTVVLKLRKGVKFHDGTDFNAEAAKFNIERMLNHPQSTGKLLLAEVTSVEAPDAETLRLTLKQPSPVIFHKLTLSWGGVGSGAPGMMSKAAVEKLGDDVGSQPAGSGPFQFEKWLRDDRVILKRFDNYWKMGEDGKPLPYYDKFEERWIPDPAISLLEIKAKSIQLTTNVEGKDVATVKADPNLTFYELPWSGISYFAAALNAKTGVFVNNLKLRQAAFYAIDRESMAKVLGFGQGIPLYYLYWTKGQLGYDESLPKYNYDPEKSKKLLAEAGYPQGLDISLDFISRPEDQRIAEIAKDMWDKVGIRTKLSAMERLAWLEKMKNCNYETNFARMSSSPDPDGHSRLVVSGGGANYICGSWPEMDKCMEEGRTTYEPAKRHEIYKRCITIMYENAHATAGYTRPDNFVYPKYVQNVRAQWQFPDLKETWLNQ